jgi:hypothetical protein
LATSSPETQWVNSVGLTGLTDIHRVGRGPGKGVQNGDRGNDEAPSSSVLHAGVQGGDRRAVRRGDRSIGQVSIDFDLTETALREWVGRALPA